MILLEILKPSFLLHHAVYGSIVVGLVCPLVGVYFVLRRLIFWGVALPQVSTAGIAFAFLLQGLGLKLFSGQEVHEKHLAILGAVLFTASTIFLLTWFEKHSEGLGEGRVGAIYALAGALSILFVAFNAAGETEMMGLLKGEIVSISEADFHAMLDAFAAIAAALLIFQREFTLVSYDRDMAVTLGRNAGLWDLLLYSIIGLTVSLGVMTVGPIVIFGLLVLPPMAALPWARGMLSLSLTAAAIGGASGLSGFYISYTRDLPLGPMIVCSAFTAYLLSQAAHLAVRMTRQRTKNAST